MAKPSFYNHWKFKMLTNELKQCRPKVLGHVQMLWDVSGIIGKIRYTDEEIEAVVEWDGVPGEFTKAMVKVGLLDKKDEMYEIHDWWDHCPNYVKRKMKAPEVKEKKEVEEDVVRDIRRLDGFIDVFNIGKEEIIKIVNGLQGSMDVKDYELLVNRTIKKYWDDEDMQWVMKDTLKRIIDARFFGREKDVGEIKNERAFFFSQIKKLN